jgi:histone deacetylase 6
MNAFALVRPPGHHSGFRNVINGFCVYNNVNTEAKYFQNNTFYLI